MLILSYISKCVCLCYFIFPSVVGETVGFSFKVALLLHGNFNFDYFLYKIKVFNAVVSPFLGLGILPGYSVNNGW